jgi:hypothetical protein
VSAREPSPKAQFAASLARFPAKIGALVKRSLPKLRRAFGGTTELVYDYGKSLVVSFTPSGRGYEGIVAVAVEPHRVRLYFQKDVPDPEGRLEGAGSKVRSLTLEAAADLDGGAVRDLIEAAVRHSGLTFPRTRPTKMVIQSSKKKSRKKAPNAPRKPTRAR